MVNLAGDDAIPFQFAQLLRQHFLRDVGNAFPQFTETLRPVHQIMEDNRLPFSAHDRQGGANGTFFRAHGFQEAARHRVVPTCCMGPLTGYYLNGLLSANKPP